MMRMRLLRNFLSRCEDGDNTTALNKESAMFFKKPVNDLTAAAVLVPIIDHPGGLTVLFTQRGKRLKDHPGQVSFPGGRMEEEDSGPIDTALRESSEEIGLVRTQVEILGELDVCLTGTGFRVVPIVGLVKPPLELHLDKFEVEDVFEVPLPLVLEPNNYRKDCIVTGSGHRREFYVLNYQERHIWGATARMLVDLCDLMAE